MRASTSLLAPLLAVPLLLPMAVAARPGWVTGTFVYADLCTDPNGGGMAGRRVVVRRSPSGDGVTYEAASGARPAPIRVESVSIDDGMRTLAFTVESADGPVRFEGIADAGVLAGTLSDAAGERPLRLRRVLRSHEHEACRAVQQDPDTTASPN